MKLSAQNLAIIFRLCQVFLYPICQFQLPVSPITSVLDLIPAPGELHRTPPVNKRVSEGNVYVVLPFLRFSSWLARRHCPLQT